ncbi:MAG: hypothetical protein QM759_15670 [Terricaulis sp.]
MFRRRYRRRSSFSRRGSLNIPVESRSLLLGAGAIVLVGLFVFFIHQADTHVPPAHEVSVDLPNALKD